MELAFTVSMVRGLKGAPLAVLVVLAMAQKPLTAEYLERTTGYTDKPVYQALLLLQDLGLVSRNGRTAWQICAGAMQLPFMVDQIEAVSEQADEVVEAPADAVTRNISESSLASLENLDLDSRTSSLNPDLDLELDPAESEKIRVADILRECKKYGIGSPTNFRLAELKFVSARLVRYHCLTAPNIKLAIYRIRANQPIKSGWADPEDKKAELADEAVYPDISAADFEKLNQAVETARNELKGRMQVWSLDKLEPGWVEPERVVYFADDFRVVDFVTQYACGILERALGKKVEFEVG
jgi:predicted transcriptional regulator